MSYLKLQNPSQVNIFNQLQGFRNGAHMLELIEDKDGNYFIHTGIKDAPQFASKLALFNSLTEVANVTVNEEDPETGVITQRVI
jgi:hypothetical protein